MIALPPGLWAESPEVFYSDDPLVTVNAALLEALKQQAAVNPRLRCRLCLHPDPMAGIHEMLIVHHRDVYVRPHRHRNRAESFTVIEGEASLVITDEAGLPRRVIHMGPLGTGQPFCCRIPPDCVHTLIIRSPWLVFSEVTSGPFSPSGTVFAEETPDGSDPIAAAAYLKALADHYPPVTTSP